MSSTWVKIPNAVWDISLCAPSRISMLTGVRWERHGCYRDAKSVEDGSTYAFAYTGSQSLNQITTLAAAASMGATTISLAPTAEPIFIDGVNSVVTVQLGTVSPVTTTVASNFSVWTSTTNNVNLNVAALSSGVSSLKAVLISPQSPQTQLLSAGSAAVFDTSWNYANTWPWYLKQAGYQTAIFGKFYNAYPYLKGDTYIPQVGSTPIFDRYFIICDDAKLQDQRSGNPSSNNCFGGSSAAYYGVDHTTHVEANYFSTLSSGTSVPWHFNNQGTASDLVPPNGDNWTPFSSYGGTGNYASRLAASNSAYITDCYNHEITKWLQGSDSSGVPPKQPFALYVATRGDHAAWVPAERHWSQTPQNVPAWVIPQTSVHLQAVATTDTSITWSGTPDLSAVSAAATTNGVFIIVGVETMQVTSGYGTSTTWNVTRNILNDVGQSMPQIASGNPAWAASTPVLVISSSLTADTGDDPSFNEQDMSDKSPWWRGETGYRTDTVSYSTSSAIITDSDIDATDVGAAVYGSGIPANSFVGSNNLNAGVSFKLVNSLGQGVTPTQSGSTIDINRDVSTADDSGIGLYMNVLACVQARHDRIIKAKTGMSLDEMIYDIWNLCCGAGPTGGSGPLFPNTVFLIISDNGWLYGQHGLPTGKINPYKLAGVGPIFAYWPSGTAGKYPYFSSRPNIVVIVTDDDDTESLTSGFPILNAALTGGRTEPNCLASNLDIPATIVDLAGANPTLNLDGQSLAPIISGAATGTSPRTYMQFGLQSSQENGTPGFSGIQTLTKRYWQWTNYTVPSTALQIGSTAAQGPIGIYTGISEGYDLNGSDTGFADADETSNSVANSSYPHPPHPFTAATLADLQSRLASSLVDVPDITTN